MPEGFWAEARERLGNGLPCWLGNRCALPNLGLRPLASGDWLVSLMVPQARNETKYVSRTIALEDIVGFLRCWADDPEETLLLVFAHTSWTDSTNPIITTKTLEELDL